MCVTVWFDFYISRTVTLLANPVFYSFSLFNIAEVLDEPLSQKEMIMASLTKSVLPADPGHSIVFSWVLAAPSGVGGQRVFERSCWHCIEKNILSAGCQLTQGNCSPYTFLQLLCKLPSLVTLIPLSITGTFVAFCCDMGGRELAPLLPFLESWIRFPEVPCALEVFAVVLPISKT